ncbi:MAG: aspartate kinase [Calditrichaeota bacterium]|nr:aspartate kinase [Calditrichota bacterium]
MALIVRKYGGSSVASIEKIKKIARQVKSLHDEGNKLVLVVSAMGETTDNLLKQAAKISDRPDKRELDMLLSIGERKSISLTSLALNALGVECQSFTGSQVGIITDNQHGNATIIEIKADRIEHALNQNKVVIVAGYQGVSIEKEITTLGRGGTDTTAVALAARLKADRCELMKDVDGLFNVPPKFLENARLRSEVSLAEMKEIAQAGNEIIAAPAIDFAIKGQVKLSIGNTFTNKIGTSIVVEDKRQAGISQVILKKCTISTDQDFKPNSRMIQFNSEKLLIHLDPDNKSTNSIFLTLLGKQLFDLNDQIQSLYKHSLFSSINNDKAEFLYPKEYEDELIKILEEIAN